MLCLRLATPLAEPLRKHTPSVTGHDVRRALVRVNTRNAAGPDCISGLKSTENLC